MPSTQSAFPLLYLGHFVFAETQNPRSTISKRRGSFWLKSFRNFSLWSARWNEETACQSNLVQRKIAFLMVLKKQRDARKLGSRLTSMACLFWHHQLIVSQISHCVHSNTFKTRENLGANLDPNDSMTVWTPLII